MEKEWEGSQKVFPRERVSMAYDKQYGMMISLNKAMVDHHVDLNQDVDHDNDDNILDQKQKNLKLNMLSLIMNYTNRAYDSTTIMTLLFQFSSVVIFAAEKYI